MACLNSFVCTLLFLYFVTFTPFHSHILETETKVYFVLSCTFFDIYILDYHVYCIFLTLTYWINQTETEMFLLCRALF